MHFAAILKARLHPRSLKPPANIYVVDVVDDSCKPEADQRPKTQAKQKTQKKRRPGMTL